MEKEWPTSIVLDEQFHSRIINWNEKDRIVIVLLCEMFEQFGFDAIFIRADYMMTPAISPDGEIDRVVFELAMTFGRKTLQVNRVDQGKFILSD